MSTISKPEESQTQPYSPQEDTQKANLGLDSFEKRKRQIQQFYYEFLELEFHDQTVNQIIQFYLQAILAFWDRVTAESEIKAWERMLLMRNMDTRGSLEFVFNLPRELALMGEIKALQEELVKCREVLAEAILEAFKPVSEAENIVVASFEVEGKVVEVRVNEALEYAREELAGKARKGELKSNNLDELGSKAMTDFLRTKGASNEKSILIGNNIYTKHLQPRLNSESFTTKLKKSDEIDNLLKKLEINITNPSNKTNMTNEKIAPPNQKNRSLIVGLNSFKEIKVKVENENNAEADKHPAKKPQF